MIPLYRKDCLPSDLPAWDVAREKALITLLVHGKTFRWAWYTYIQTGVLP